MVWTTGELPKCHGKYTSLDVWALAHHIASGELCEPEEVCFPLWVLVSKSIKSTNVLDTAS